MKFDSSISAKSTRRGDRFTATVDGDRYLPSGTKLVGRVADIQRKDGDRKAFADLEFTEIELPNGRKVDIEAYPVPINDRTVRRDRNGRMEAKKATRRDNVVIGSTVGGLILGTIFKKPFEGTVIGALAGILVAETDALNTNGEMIVDKGQKMGAAFEREVSIDGRDDGYRSDDRDVRDVDRDRDRQNRDQDTRGEVDSRSILLEFDKQELRFNANRAPYRDGSTVMVPLAEMADQLGLEVSRTSEKIFFLEDEDNVLKLEQNRSDARLNSKRISLPRAIVEKDGIMYVPIEAFAAIKRDALYVNGTRVVSRT
ncbi:MAG: hypothetical protein H7Y17_01395 [Chlorobia bacterium]|nr:hypothetical protein [Fimbriimonadaceae bacterium]